MNTITILPDDVITKIAAGEVVERPASVVKELVENSLDAGAKVVTVELEDSGKKLIRVADNGRGMTRDDAKLSIVRHATSKLQSIEDLASIMTLGFRGEALATISSVSQFSLVTKQEGSVAGLSILVEGGEVINEDDIAADVGTTIEVRNLFYNTPARKKFLKTDAVELRHIVDVVTHYALLHPEVAFTLLHEGHSLVQSPAVEDQRQNIAALYGSSVAKDLLEVSFEKEGIRVAGFIGKPHQCRNDKSHQVLFVNDRYVKQRDITNAVYEGYHSLLFTGKHPVFVLTITLDPSRIDVNVHPQKTEIKIEQKDVVCNVVTTAVTKTLREHKLFPVLDFEFTSDAQKMSAPSLKDKGKYTFEKSTQQVLEVREKGVELHDEVEEGDDLKEGLVEKEKVASEPLSSSEPSPPKVEVYHEEGKAVSNLPELRLLGQVHKTFFVAETDGGVFFIDQHAAHERVMYERYMHQFVKGDVKVQTLLQGGVIECSPAHKVLVDEHKSFLEKLGFALEHFGGNTFVLKSVPTIFGRLQPQELFHEVLEELEQGKDKITQIEEVIATRMACRSAVMAGDELTNNAMNDILHELDKTDLPYTCPHGRPTMIKTTVTDLEKKFKRKV